MKVQFVIYFQYIVTVIAVGSPHEIMHFGSQSMKAVDQGQEQSRGEFWMTRKCPGWKVALEG